ncbi:MAG: PilZ domain-containing protein [Myxococcota bacterium]
MKRLLVVSDDRELTARVADTFEGDEYGPAGVWHVARAHAGREALVLIERGERPFDAVVIAPPLPDHGPSDFFGRLSDAPDGRQLAAYLIGDLDDALRQTLQTSFKTTDHFEAPVDLEALRHALDALPMPLDVLLAESDEGRRLRYAKHLTDAGYRLETATTGRQAIERQPRLRPSAVIANLELSDLPGLTVCDHVRRAAVTPVPSIILYGSPTAFKTQTQAHPGRGPDDFVAAPFDDELLIDRLAARIGRTRGHRWRRTSSRSVDPQDPNPGDRRRFPRTFGNIDVTVHTEDLPPSGAKTFTAETFDMSPGGLFLVTDHRIPVGTRIDLTIELGDGEDDGPVRATAEVAWLSYTGPRLGMGVRYVAIDRRAVQRLQSYVALVAEVL